MSSVNRRAIRRIYIYIYIYTARSAQLARASLGAYQLTELPVNPLSPTKLPIYKGAIYIYIYIYKYIKSS